MTQPAYVTGVDFPVAAVASTNGAFVYVTSETGNRVDIIRTSDNTRTGSISLTGLVPAGIAVSPSGTHLYVAMSGSNSVSVVETATNLEVANVNVGMSPQGLAVATYTSGGSAYERLAVTNSGADSVTLLDISTPATPTNPITVSVGMAPIFPAASGDRLYVPNYLGSSLSVVSLASNSVTSTIALPSGSRPRQVAVTPDGLVAYVTDEARGFVLAVDTNSGTVTNQVAVRGAFSIAMGANGAAVFVTQPGEDAFVAINTSTHSIYDTINLQLGMNPLYLAITPDGDRLYIPNYYVSNVAVAGTGLRSITFDGNGGVNSMVPQPGYSNTPIAGNQFSRAGFTFTGWSTSSGVAPVVYADGATYSFQDDTTLYAQWSAAATSHTVTFHSNGGSGAMAPQTASAPTALTANTFTRANYTFDGWSTSPGIAAVAYTNQAVFPFTADDTLYAQWSAIPSPPVPPSLPPSAPLTVTATAGGASATVTWAQPLSSGTFPITSYQAVVSPGGQACLVTAPTLTCTISGLTNGTTYTAIVRALNGAGWSPDSAPSADFTPQPPPPPPTPTISITGTRADFNGRPGVVVDGATTELATGAVLRPWVRFPGQTAYTQGAARILISQDGTFTWQRRTGKRIYVIIKTEDGGISSNRLVVQTR